MDLARIPYSFIKKRASLSWRDVLWGYENKLLQWQDVVAIALDRLPSGSENELELELASSVKPENWKAEELVRALSERELLENQAPPGAKWLFLVLAWLSDNKGADPNSLSEVERIYVEFGYPPEIAGFVRYMPTSDGYDPRKHSIEENTDRLLLKWKQYLVGAGQKHGLKH